MSRSLRNRSRNIKRDRYRIGSYLYDFRSRTYDIGRLPIKGPDRIEPITAGAGATFVNDAASADGWNLNHADDDLWIGTVGSGTRITQGNVSGVRKYQTIEFDPGVLLKVTGPITTTYFNCVSSPTVIIGELDVSALTSLIDLRCYENSITVLDVSALTDLTYLHCGDNSISILDVSALASLITLQCHENSITVLDVSALTDLTYLRCGSNSISILDVSALTSLTFLWCHENSITILDVPTLTSLTALRASSNSITTYADGTLDLLDSLEYVYYDNNAMPTAVVDNIVDDMYVDRAAKSVMTLLRLAGTNSAVTGTYQEPVDHNNPANAAEAAWVLVNDEGWTVEINTV